MTTIGFIGGGKMAEAIISRLGSPRSIIASDISRKRLNYLKKKYGIKTTTDNLGAFSAEIVVLAVKPQNMSDVVAGLAPQIKKAKLIVSIAAGIPLSYLQRKLPGVSIVRAMPNNPCLVGAGITALAMGRGTGEEERRKAKEIFRSVGEVIEVAERWMDAVTGLSGSGPAFVYQSIEALTSGGIAAGLPKTVAAKLASQTVLGAAVTVKESGMSPKELREMVASPGGTTIEGLKMLKKRRFSRALLEAVMAATKKSKVLSRKWTS